VITDSKNQVATQSHCWTGWQVDRSIKQSINQFYSASYKA